MLPLRALSSLLLVTWSSLAVAADGLPTAPAAPAAGDHRRGVRVQLELVPVVVRTCFRTHGGEDLSAVLRRTDASGQLVYIGRVHDPDQSVQILVVSVTGQVVDKQPPRHHATWTAPQDQWAAEDDWSLWGAGSTAAAASATSWSLWGSAIADPLAEASRRRDDLLRDRTPVGALAPLNR